MKDIIEVDGYAIWAPFLINGDADGLEDIDLRECREWLEFHGLDAGNAIDCGEESFFGTPDYPNAVKGNCVTYSFLYKK